jgi:hypothetical protein
MTDLYTRKRVAAWPEGKFDTVIVSNLDPVPADVPEQPRSVVSLAAVLESAGWETRIGFARAYRRGQRTGTYRIMESYGVFAGNHDSTHYRVVAVYWRFADKTHEFTHYPETGLEESEKACGTPGNWTWQDSRILDGMKRHRMKVTDVKEFASVRGSVLPGWFAGIARRFAEQAARQLCGDPEEHDPHSWETVNAIMKICSGKATKPKETEAS